MIRALRPPTLEVAEVSGKWGNLHAAQRNLEKPRPPVYDEETDDLKNDPDMPICAWGLAQRIA